MRRIVTLLVAMGALAAVAPASASAYLHEANAKSRMVNYVWNAQCNSVLPACTNVVAGGCDRYSASEVHCNVRTYHPAGTRYSFCDGRYNLWGSDGSISLRQIGYWSCAPR